METPRRLRTLIVTGLLLAGTASGRPGLQAQGTVLGSFRWQLQPFCNVLTVNVVQVGAQYHLDGTDDLCGASRRASVVGLAFPNPDGSIGFGLTTVTVPGGTPLHVDATISLATVSGTWRDSGGNTGAFVFTPGAGTGGSPRPIPAGGIAPGTITSAQLAPGSVTTAQIAQGSVTAALIAPGALNAAVAAFGTCPAGQYLRGIQPNGTVLCEPIGTPPLSTTVDEGIKNQLGEYSSLAIGSNGLPIISHYGLNGGALRVTRCSNAACTSATSIQVDAPFPSRVGQYSSLAIGSDGLPVISHYDATAFALRVTHCSDVACTSATSTTLDDQANNVGQYSSLAIGSDGLPVISHRDSTLGTLRVTHCSNVACTSATSTTADDHPRKSVGVDTSLAIGTDGFPIISHRDLSADALRVTHCSNVACTSAISVTLDDQPNLVGLYTSLAIGSDGLPVIGHLDSTAGALRVTHCTDVACTSATSTTVDDLANRVGFYTSLAIGSDGLPVISHHDLTAGTLRVTHCSNVACTSATSRTVDDPANRVGVYTSIAIGSDGLPVISYQDLTAHTLRVTKCASRTCQ